MNVCVCVCVCVCMCVCVCKGTKRLGDRIKRKFKVNTCNMSWAPGVHVEEHNLTMDWDGG